jgi:hypothetical protein
MEHLEALPTQLRNHNPHPYLDLRFPSPHSISVLAPLNTKLSPKTSPFPTQSFLLENIFLALATISLSLLHTQSSTNVHSARLSRQLIFPHLQNFQ